MPNGAHQRPLSDRVHQATGMVSVQAHCDIAEALNPLRIRALAMGQSLEVTALDVLDGQIRFDD
ncbi:MAG: hypothetical protein M3Q30_13940 [Actinomycetota bacterium]|nr:hypothetical protein [Actinomycetota bacterium]